MLTLSVIIEKQGRRQNLPDGRGGGGTTTTEGPNW